MSPALDGKHKNAQVFFVTPDQLLRRVQAIGTGEGDISDDATELLLDVGLAASHGNKLELTESGLLLFRAAWVFKDSSSSKVLLGQAMRTTVPLQVLSQELRSFGAVPEDGVVNLLAMHGVVPLSFPIESARRTFRWLNECRVIAYSSKLKSVRFIPDDIEAAKPGEKPELAAMISPRTPYSNLVRLRRVLRTLKGVVTWADPHFSARALEELIDELDPVSVKELRILSGRQADLSPKSFKEYQRFVQEMASKGVAVEWRIDATERDWHDRFLVHAGGSFNVPPVNTLFKGDYSEILESKDSPPVGEWWSRAAPRVC